MWHAHSVPNSMAGTFPGFLHKAKETRKYIFPPPLGLVSKSTQLESLKQGAWPDIFFKSYMLLDNNHFFNTAEKFKGT